MATPIGPFTPSALRAQVYVLHAFQKKSKKGIATPKQDIALITRRLRVAEEDYRTRFEREG